MSHDGGSADTFRNYRPLTWVAVIALGVVGGLLLWHLPGWIQAYREESDRRENGLAQAELRAIEEAAREKVKRSIWDGEEAYYDWEAILTDARYDRSNLDLQQRIEMHSRYKDRKSRFQMDTIWREEYVALNRAIKKVKELPQGHDGDQWLKTLEALEAQVELKIHAINAKTKNSQ